MVVLLEIEIQEIKDGEFSHRADYSIGYGGIEKGKPRFPSPL